MATGKIYRTDYWAALANIIDKEAAKKILADSEILRLSEIKEEKLTPEQMEEIVDTIIEQVDLTGKVDKVAGSSLVQDTEIAKIHAPASDDQDLSGKVDKETGKGLSTNNYTHPANHSPSIITQNVSNRFVSDTEKSTWNGKEPGNSNIQTHVTSAHAPSNAVALATVKADSEIADAITKKHSNNLDHSHSNKSILDSIQESLTTPLKSSYDNAYSHSQSTHAPVDAQKNSDITKAEIEAKLTGEISSHTHAGGGVGLGYTLHVQALTSSPADGATIYFGQLPKAPITTANISKVYVRKAGTIKMAQIYCYSGTAGTSEAWSLYVRKNNTTDTLIATLSVSASERIFTNSALSIAVAAGDYIEIKAINPTWATNPLTTIFGGYLYIE